MSEKINAEIEKNVRNNTIWSNLPIHIKQVLKNCPDEYHSYVFNYSLDNQLRYRGNLVRKIFKNEERYYELLIERSICNLCLFPYHLADIVTKGLRVTPFNYYIEVLCNFLKKEKSYDTLPNFTAADCLRVLGIGRNEYLSLASQLKTNSSRLFRRPNPKQFLPKFPIKINIEPWWKAEVGYVLEKDIKYVSEAEKKLIDEIIDSGPKTVGECDYNVIHNLYKKGLIYLDVPIDDDDKICIPPLRNFVMNRLSGDYFENLLYKIFVSTDEHMTIYELSKVLQIDLETVKYAVSLICRLGFAKKKSIDINKLCTHKSWLNYEIENDDNIPLNYNSLLLHSNNLSSKSNVIFVEEQQQQQHQQHHHHQQQQIKPEQQQQQQQEQQSRHVQILEIPSDVFSDNLYEYVSTNCSSCDFSFNEVVSVNEDSEEFSKTLSSDTVSISLKTSSENYKRVGFLFDSTLTAFLMMGNLSPGLKNHAVTMFEVGKLCDESMSKFLSELEKVSLLDAEGEGEVSRYFAHAVILRSTIIALRNAFKNGLDLLRLESLESLDYKIRNKLLEKKYKFIISASPLTGFLTHPFTIPFFGQFYRSSETSHIWSKFFYYHISGYGPPSLFLTKGTILKSLPRLFLGYGKLLVTIVHTDSYIISSENYHNINDQLQMECVLVQGYGIKQIGQIKYESFPFDMNDQTKIQWSKHKGVLKLKEHLDLEHNCGYITFVNTGVPDIGCEDYDINVRLTRSKTKIKKSLPNNLIHNNDNSDIHENDKKIQIETSNSTISSTPTILNFCSSMDNSEVTSFNRSKQLSESTLIQATSMLSLTGSKTKVIEHLRTPDENYFAVTPKNSSPSNVYRSEDCNELLASILDKLNYEKNNFNDDSNEMNDNLKNNENDFQINAQISSSQSLLEEHEQQQEQQIEEQEEQQKEEQQELQHEEQKEQQQEQQQEQQHEEQQELQHEEQKEQQQEQQHEEQHEEQKEQQQQISKQQNESQNDLNSINDDEDTISESQPKKLYERNDEMWTILDVHFGVPLFDADCNTRICEQIVKYLSTKENLENLPSSQAAMNEKFLNFVKQCLYFEDEYNDIIRIGKILPQPRINLAFENGKVCYWSGK